MSAACVYMDVNRAGKGSDTFVMCTDGISVYVWSTCGVRMHLLCVLSTVYVPGCLTSGPLVLPTCTCLAGKPFLSPLLYVWLLSPLLCVLYLMSSKYLIT